MPFSAKWFLLYYGLLGLSLIAVGGYLILQKESATAWLLQAAHQEKPPVLLIRTLKYGALFTLPGLVLSFFPFSWIELLFCFWSLLLLYIGSAQLVRWPQSRRLIQDNEASLPATIQRGGAIMMAVGFAILLLAYLVVLRAI